MNRSIITPQIPNTHWSSLDLTRYEEYAREDAFERGEIESSGLNLKPPAYYVDTLPPYYPGMWIPGSRLAAVTYAIASVCTALLAVGSGSWFASLAWLLSSVWLSFRSMRAARKVHELWDPNMALTWCLAPGEIRSLPAETYSSFVRGLYVRETDQ